MKLTNLIKVVFMIIVFSIAITGTAMAQTTWYVDVQKGLDSYNGLQPDYGGPGIGPKQTLNNAIQAASPGDIISVAYANGNLYNQNVVVDRKLILTSTGGRPRFVSCTVNITAGAPNNTATFIGDYEFTSALTLQDGEVIGGNRIWVGDSNTGNGGAVTRTDGTVDSQLNYIGVNNFLYNGGAAVISGFELPASTNSTAFGNLQTTGGTALTINENKIINGTITTASTVALNGNQLTIKGNNTPHTIGGDVTNGTLAFTLTGNVVVNGNFDLPHIEATTTGGTNYLLTLNTNQQTENLTANNRASIDALTATQVGNVVGNGSRNIRLRDTTTISSIANNGTGMIEMVNAATAISVTGNVSLTSRGYILFDNTGNTNIGGSIINSAALTVTNAIVNAGANYGVINFAQDVVLNVTGNIQNDVTISGSPSSSTNWDDAGSILISTATNDVTVTGSVINSSRHDMISGSGGVGVDNCARINFASSTGDVYVSNGFTNSSNWGNVSGITVTNNGQIRFNARGVGSSMGSSTNRIGNIINNSTSTNNSGNGDIILNDGDKFWGNSVTSSGASGGNVEFGNEDIDLLGSVTNSRTSTYATGHIQFGSTNTAGVDVLINGALNNEGKSSIVFPGFDGGAAETFTVGGLLSNSGTGAIKIAGGTYTSTASFQFGALSLTNGTIEVGVDNNATMDVIISGTADFIAGTFNMGTFTGDAGTAPNPATLAVATPRAGNRELILRGIQNKFSSATQRTTFPVSGGSASMGNVVMIIQSPSIQQQTMTGNLTETVWYGPLVVNNSVTPLDPAVTFNGGNFRFLWDVHFLAGKVKLDDISLFVGGQLAPYNGVGDFFNTAGYSTNGNASVSMNGNANADVSGAGSFGNFEVDMGANACDVQAGTGPMTAMFGLASGQVTSSANVNFNNATTPPTIVRNAGDFDVAPTFTTQVDVIYIGLNKTTDDELPVAANRLRNLKIATTNSGVGLVAGKGVIRLQNNNITVNGTLTIEENQAFLLDGFSVTMNGSSVILNGDMANDAAGTGKLYLNRASGTNIVASSILPDLIVNAGSQGNTITGQSVTFARGLLGPNNVRGTGTTEPGDDINPGNSGTITFAGGAASSLALNLGAVNGTTLAHLANITTAAGATLTLQNDVVMSGDLNHAGGTINVSEHTLTVKGNSPQFTGGTATTGTGKVIFSSSTPTTLTMNGSSVTIGTNVQINQGAAGTLFTLDPASAGTQLTISGNMELTRGTVQLGNGATGKNLRLTGQMFTIGANGSINTTGIGILILNPTTPPMTMSYTGAPTLGNVTVSNNVTLAGTGTALTISGTFLHNGGLLDFNSRDITVTGTFQRTAGTYAATSGYLIIDTPNFTQGSGFSIPNLRITEATPFGISSNANFTVTKRFDLVTGGTTFTHTSGGVARMNISPDAIVTFTSGNLDAVPVYGGSITLIANPPATVTIPTLIWPASPDTLVANLEINSPGNTVRTPGTRKVNKMLTLTAGDFNVSASTTLTLVDNVDIYVVDGTMSTSGSLVYGNGLNVTYKNNGTIHQTTKELAPTINNLTFTRNANIANVATQVTTPVTVKGTLTVKNNVTTLTTTSVPASLVDATIATEGDVVFEKDSFSNATNPVTIFNAPLKFNGSANQIVTVPSTGIDLTGGPAVNAAANIHIAKTNRSNTVTLQGGELKTGVIQFENGLFVTGSNILTIPAPLQNQPTLGQGFDRSLVVGGNISHVVGKVRKRFVNTNAINTSTNERSEFPVGSDTLYSPVAVTFQPQFGLPTMPNGLELTVSHEYQEPTGIIGLPVADAVEPGVDVKSYAPFYWDIQSNIDVGQNLFDLELTMSGWAEYDTVKDVRIVRRHGSNTDTENEWRLQGNSTNYDNARYEESPIRTVVINENSLGGLRSDGAIFTYGLKDPAQGGLKHFSLVWQDNPYKPMDIFVTQTSLNGVDMAVGDEIGVYDGDKCVGASIVTTAPSRTNPLQIVCSAAEPGLTNGFTIGNAITFKMWDKSTNIEYNSSSVFVDPNSASRVVVAAPTFQQQETAAVELTDTGLPVVTQNVILNTGWNIFSLAVTPNGSQDMLDILNPIQDKLTKVIDEQGNTVIQLFGNWQNTIGDWAKTEGYYIKVTQTCTLSVTGLEIPKPTTIPLSNGWNMISYPAMAAQSSDAVFQSLKDSGILVKVMNEGFGTIQNLWGTWYNSIGNLLNGEGYYVKVNDNGQLSINEPGALLKSAPVKEQVESVHFEKAYQGNPYNPMNIFVTKATLDGVDLAAGDEIAVFDGDVCVASAVYEEGINKSAPLMLVASQNDDAEQLNGFETGNPLVFKVWDKDADTEITLNAEHVSIQAIEGEKNINTFEELGSVAVTLNAENEIIEALPTSFALDQNFPNPFNPTTTINYALPQEASVTINVYDIRGQLVTTLFDGNKAAGYHSIKWNGTNAAGLKVASGMYFYNIIAGDFKASKKMVFTK